MPTNQTTTFAAELRAAVALAEVSQPEAARLVNVSADTVSKWVRGLAEPHALMQTAVLDVLRKAKK